jgi:hypothetical protein
MGLSVRPVFEKPLNLPRTESTGEFLGASFEALDEIALENNLSPLSAFGDTREVPDDFDGDPDTLDEVIGPCTDWFDSSKGVASLSRLQDLLATRKELASRLDGPGEVIAELQDLVRQLQVAAAKGIRFRLELG